VLVQASCTAAAAAATTDATVKHSASLIRHHTASKGLTYALLIPVHCVRHTTLHQCRGSNANTADQKQQWTALHRACAMGHDDVVFVLLDAGCDVKLLDKQVVVLLLSQQQTC
jgi:Ankyrin repeat